MDIAIQNMKQKLDVNLKKSSFVAGRLIDTYLFGEQHPYGQFSRHEDFNALTRDGLVNFYQQYYKQGQFKIFIAGKLPGNIESLLDTYFGDFDNHVVADKQHVVAPDLQKNTG
ncbi:insulinase family protein [Niabella hibiscisoli]|uniref:insulinase family protein n=1 Tax=Niabella hibiscisoli TaxID=1825928 RepID=UPI0021D41BFE|nr:insulinase family protein [Niabella hibiscisoli]